MPTCAHLIQLTPYINDELYEATRQELEQHIESCIDCQHELESLTSNVDLQLGSSVFAGVSQDNSHSEPGSQPKQDQHAGLSRGFLERLLREGPEGSVDISTGEKVPSAVPEQIGDYRIIREIGRGGMGVVYEAEQTSLRRRVALKVLNQPAQLRQDYRTRFKREAQAAAQMQHPNIVPVFEVNSQDGYFYYAMQLIHGLSLDLVLNHLRNVQDRSRALDTDELATVAKSDHAIAGTRTDLHSLSAQWSDGTSNSGTQAYYRAIVTLVQKVAEALDYAHAQGVVHRDVKPSNLILGRTGKVWVTDFGLAKTDDEGMTETGDFLGTLRYMSPESLIGQCDHRTDIYALGITLYELLVLQPAYSHLNRLQLVNAIHQFEPISLRALDQRIPIDLETIVLKASEKDPAARYASAGALAADLSRFIGNQPILARRTTYREKAIRFTRKNLRWVLGLSVAGVLGAVFAILLLEPNVSTVSSRTPDNFPSAQSHLHATERVREIAAALLRNGARIYSTTANGTVGMKVPGDIPVEYFQIGIVDLSNAQNIEESLLLVNQLPELYELWIKNISLTETMVVSIAATRSLETIDLSGTDLDDAGIEEFIGMPRLKELSLLQTKVTRGAVRRFRGLHEKEIAIAWDRDR